MLRMTRQGISHSQRVCGDIPCHDASCADDRAVPDGYAGKHDDAAAQPAAVSDSNGQGVGAAEIFLRLGVPVRSQPFRQLYRMRRRVKLYIGSDQNIVSDFDFIAVHKGAVHVNGHIVSDMDIVSVIAEKRLGYRNVCTGLIEQTVKNFSLFFLLLILQGIVFFQQLPGFRL